MRTGNLLLMCVLTMMGCGSNELLQSIVAQDDVIFTPTREVRMEAEPVHAQEPPEDPQWERIPRAPMRLDEQPSEATDDVDEGIGNIEEEAPAEDVDVEDETPAVAEEVEEVPQDPLIEEETEIVEPDVEETEPPSEDSVDTVEDDHATEEPEDEFVPSSADPSCSEGVDHYIRFAPDGSFTIVYCEDDNEPAPVMENPPVEDPPTDEGSTEETPDPLIEEVDEESPPVSEEEEPIQIPLDMDADGFMENEDCNDLDAAVRPDATETCDDGTDNNCNGFVDNEAEVDGCFIDIVEEIPPTEEIPPVEEEIADVSEEMQEESLSEEPVVRVTTGLLTSDVEVVSVYTGEENEMDFGGLALSCGAEHCTVKSVALRLTVQDERVDLRDVFWRCRLNQLFPIAVGGVGGPRSLDGNGKYVSSTEFPLEPVGAITFALACEMISSAPATGRITATLLREETVIWDQDSNPLPLSCTEAEDDPVITIVDYTFR